MTFSALGSDVMNNLVFIYLLCSGSAFKAEVLKAGLNLPMTPSAVELVLADRSPHQDC